MRNRGVDVERFASNLLLTISLKMLKRPHVVQAVSEFDEDDADVVHHRQHHLAKVLGLGFFGGREIDFADLRHAFDNVGNLLAEFWRISTVVTEVSSTES